MVSCILDVHFPLINSKILHPITIFFFLIPFATPLSFNFTSFTANDSDIRIEGSAEFSDDVIQLTTNYGPRSGRAMYARPLHLWDRASGNLTDFTTNFSFVIYTSIGIGGDGFTFFLVPNGSTIPENSTGGVLGLTSLDEAWGSTRHPFVAVEFDIVWNNWDQITGHHVGVDVNSMVSVANVSWDSAMSIMRGLEHEVSISYDSQSMNLSVVISNRTLNIQRLSYRVNLSDYLPEFVSVGFSAATGGSASVHSVSSWSFISNLELNGNRTNSFTPGNVSGNMKTRLVIGLVVGVGGLILVLVLGLILYFFWKRKEGLVNNSEEISIVLNDDEFLRHIGAKNFAYDVLKQATNNFSLENKLGRGGFGSVYKGFLREVDSFVAVKRFSSVPGQGQGKKEYAAEVKIISTLRHRNLVELIGWCHQKEELLLVYKFMPNGSLDSHLFKGRSLLSWGIRFKIVLGLASAVFYLQEEWNQYVLHRDIKSSNIMLDENFDAKLGDFGLARLVDHEKGDMTTVAAGTPGYMAPECASSHYKASKKADVFSFGVVALEIATGKKPNFDVPDDGDQVNLIDWVWDHYGTGKLLDAADSLLDNNFNAREMKQLMTVGLWCAQPDSELRPSIREAILVLNFEANLPSLPPRMPVAIYCPPPGR